jgi:hypothetical protein
VLDGVEETAITNLPPGTGFLLPETIAQKAAPERRPARRDQEQRSPNARNGPRSRRFEEPAFSSGFRRTGWWRTQLSETSLQPCFSCKLPKSWPFLTIQFGMHRDIRCLPRSVRLPTV